MSKHSLFSSFAKFGSLPPGVGFEAVSFMKEKVREELKVGKPKN